uniref:Uncharacterized protein n=1 Tax=Arundo donax TaxID=35708 RepID=A0A0A9DQ00_ARUDO
MKDKKIFHLPAHVLAAWCYVDQHGQCCSRTCLFADGYTGYHGRPGMLPLQSQDHQGPRLPQRGILHREGGVRREEEQGGGAREVRRREALQEGLVQGLQGRQGDHHRRRLAAAEA